ncbi:unnamed protein product [Symbiodinium sp. CCMP2592]|nr:unnamed protein product [Symbiodinium sp. CCMP2592]
MAATAVKAVVEECGRLPLPPSAEKSPPSLQTNMEGKAVGFLKNLAGMSQTYTIRNETACTVKVLLTEDPEALKTVAKAKGAVGLDFAPGAGNVPVGMGGQAALAAVQGQRKPVDLTIGANSETSTTAATSTVFAAVAFWANGKFKFVWENRGIEASSTVCLLQRHLDDISEPWIMANSLQDALSRKQDGYPRCNQHPALPQAVTIPSDAKCTKSPGYETPQGFSDVTQLAVWSQTYGAFLPARILGVAHRPCLDHQGGPLPVGSVHVELDYPNGTNARKTLTPDQFAAIVQEKPRT